MVHASKAMGELLKHIAAVTQYIDAMKKSSPAVYGQAVAQQETALRTKISSMKLSLSDAAEAVKALPEVLLVLTDIQKAVSCECSEGPKKLQRIALQDWSNFEHYCTDALWAKLLTKDVCQQAKIDSLVMHATRMGLQHPSESTYQLIAGMFLMTTSQEEALNMTAENRLQLLRTLKASFKKVSLAVEPHTPKVEAPVKLPISVSEFQQNHPEWWTFAFPGGLPVPSKISLLDLNQMMATVPMRASRRDSARQSATSHQVGVASQQMSLPGFSLHAAEQFGGAMMRQMQQMQSHLNKISGMMASDVEQEASFSYANPTVSAQRCLGKINSRIGLIAGGPPTAFMLQASPTHGLESRATPAGEGKLSLPAIADGVALLQPPVAEAEGEVQRTGKPSPLQAAKQVADMLALKSVEAKEQRKVDKAAEKAAEKACEQAAESAATKATKPEPKAKAKAKSNAKPTEKPKSEAKPKSQVKPVAKAKVKTPKAKAKGAANKHSGHKRLFGCTRCRGMRGCSASCVIRGTRPLDEPYTKQRK